MTDPLSIGTVGTIAGTLLGIALTRGIDAIVKYRKQLRNECDADDDRADTSYKYTINRLESEIKELRGEVLSLRKMYDAEARLSSRLQARVEYLESREKGQ